MDIHARRSIPPVPHQDAPQLRLADGGPIGLVGGSFVMTADKHKTLVLICGYGGSGKSEAGKLLARQTHWPLLDKDTLTRPFVEELLHHKGLDANDRESEIYRSQIRPIEYRCLMQAGWENLDSGNSTILTAPFLAEVTNELWVKRLNQRCALNGTKLVIVWVECDADGIRRRLTERGAGRDRWKLTHWAEYVNCTPAVTETDQNTLLTPVWSHLDLSVYPYGEYRTLNNAADSMSTLVQSIDALAAEMTR